MTAKEIILNYLKTNQISEEELEALTSTRPIEKVPYKEITDPVSIKCDCGPESFTILVDKTDVKMANKLIGLTGIVMEYLFRKHIDIVAIECFGILSDIIGFYWEVEDNNLCIKDRS